MEKIRTFELDRWSEPDEQHRVRHIGMADAKETFEKLETHLKEKGMLPDEYFLYDVDMRTKARELPDFNFALCVPNFGGSEGIYLDIDLIYCEEDGKLSLLVKAGIGGFHTAGKQLAGKACNGVISYCVGFLSEPLQEEP